MRKIAIIVALAVATGLVLGIVVAGGDGDGASRQVPLPELTGPGGDSTSTSTGPGGDSTSTGEDTTTTGETTSPDGGQDGSTNSKGDGSASTGGAGEPPKDSPENDVPPPQGSPAERFEQFCAENPSAC